MAIEERTRPYEVLIRINTDGSIGASYRTLFELVSDGVVVSASESPPLPLSVAEGESGMSLSDILGEANLEVLKENERLVQQLAELQAKLDQQEQP